MPETQIPGSSASACHPRPLQRAKVTCGAEGTGRRRAAGCQAADTIGQGRGVPRKAGSDTALCSERTSAGHRLPTHSPVSTPRAQAQAVTAS